MSTGNASFQIKGELLSFGYPLTPRKRRKHAVSTEAGWKIKDESQVLRYDIIKKPRNDIVILNADDAIPIDLQYATYFIKRTMDYAMAEAAMKQVKLFVDANKSTTGILVVKKIRIGSPESSTAITITMSTRTGMHELLVSPSFSFTIAGIAFAVSAILFATGNYLPLISFGVGTIAFTTLGSLKLLLDRAIRSGLPK